MAGNAPLFWLTLALLMPLGGCTEQPGDDILRPPPQFERALTALGERARASSQRLATQAQRGSQRLVRRSRRITAPVLAQAIRHAEAQAARSGAKPIPEAVRKALAPHFAAEILSSVRWSTGNGRINLGTLLTEQFMDEGAVTLNRQIVFSSRRLTQNLWLWAHELAHVEQYRRMGINRFAAAYVADWRKIEEEANARANAVTAAIRKAR